MTTDKEQIAINKTKIERNEMWLAGLDALVHKLLLGIILLGAGYIGTEVIKGMLGHTPLIEHILFAMAILSYGSFSFYLFYKGLMVSSRRFMLVAAALMSMTAFIRVEYGFGDSEVSSILFRVPMFLSGCFFVIELIKPKNGTTDCGPDCSWWQKPWKVALIAAIATDIALMIIATGAGGDLAAWFGLTGLMLFGWGFVQLAHMGNSWAYAFCAGCFHIMPMLLMFSRITPSLWQWLRVSFFGLFLLSIIVLTVREIRRANARQKREAAKLPFVCDKQD